MASNSGRLVKRISLYSKSGRYERGAIFQSFPGLIGGKWLSFFKKNGWESILRPCEKYNFFKVVALGGYIFSVVFCLLNTHTLWGISLSNPWLLVPYYLLHHHLSTVSSRCVIFDKNFGNINIFMQYFTLELELWQMDFI